MDATDTSVKCAKCLSALPAAPDEPVTERTPCPRCRSKGRQFEVEKTENLALRDSMGWKERHGNAGRPILEGKTGASLHRLSGKWMQRGLVIDRENDRYIERVIDPKTGAVIHECEEPLSQHQGHGKAKRKPKEGGGH